MSDHDTEPDQAEPRPKWRFLRDWWPVLAQLAGVVVVATGFGVLAVWAGLAVGGAGLVAIGTIAELTG